MENYPDGNRNEESEQRELKQARARYLTRKLRWVRLADPNQFSSGLSCDSIALWSSLTEREGLMMVVRSRVTSGTVASLVSTLSTLLRTAIGVVTLLKRQSLFVLSTKSRL
jgi:hypothetical protein